MQPMSMLKAENLTISHILKCKFVTILSGLGKCTCNNVDCAYQLDQILPVMVLSTLQEGYRINN